MTENQRCSHGRAPDDWCEKCALGEYALYQTFSAQEQAARFELEAVAKIELEMIARSVPVKAPSAAKLARCAALHDKASDLRAAFLQQLHATLVQLQHWQKLAGENFHASHATEVAKAGVFRNAPFMPTGKLAELIENGLHEVVMQCPDCPAIGLNLEEISKRLATAIHAEETP